MGLLRINKKQVLMGAVFLLAGTLEYLVSRPIGSTYFLYKFRSIHSFFYRMPDLYGNLGMFAPEFFHVLAFSLISMSLFSSRTARITVCVVWFCLESTFELGQKYGPELTAYIPERLIPGNLRDFFVNGTFDSYDVIAIGLGTLTAFFIGELLSSKGESNEREQPKKGKLECFAYD